MDERNKRVLGSLSRDTFTVVIGTSHGLAGSTANLCTDSS